MPDEDWNLAIGSRHVSKASWQHSKSAMPLNPERVTMTRTGVQVGAGVGAVKEDGGEGGGMGMGRGVVVGCEVLSG